MKLYIEREPDRDAVAAILVHNKYAVQEFREKNGIWRHGLEVEDVAGNRVPAPKGAV